MTFRSPSRSWFHWGSSLSWALAALQIAVVVEGCGEAKATDGASSSTAASTGSSAAPAKTTAAPEKTAAPLPTKEAGSVADLKEKAAAIMDALKKGDAEAAGKYCLGKHHDAFVKYIAESFEKKDQSRAKGYAAWDGKLGEVRIDGDKARVAFTSDDRTVTYLSFRTKDGEWSLDDIPFAQKADWDKWGKVAE